MRLGLNAIEFSEWIKYEDDFSDRINEKQNLINKRGKQVLDAMPGSLLVQQEFLGLVLKNIQQHHMDRFVISDDEIVSKKQ